MPRLKFRSELAVFHDLLRLRRQRRREAAVRDAAPPPQCFPASPERIIDTAAIEKSKIVDGLADNRWLAKNPKSRFRIRSMTALEHRAYGMARNIDCPQVFVALLPDGTHSRLFVTTELLSSPR